MDFFTVESILSEEKCTEIIQQAENIQFNKMNYYNKQKDQDEFNINVRNSSYVELDDENLLNVIYTSLKDKNTIEGDFKISPNLRIMKYNTGGFFKPHRDTVYETNNFIGKYNLIIYLNKGYIGGETCFIDTVDKRYYPVKGDIGTGLLFDPTLLHTGSTVHEGAKYILVTQILIKKDN